MSLQYCHDYKKIFPVLNETRGIGLLAGLVGKQGPYSDIVLIILIVKDLMF